MCAYERPIARDLGIQGTQKGGLYEEGLYAEASKLSVKGCGCSNDLPRGVFEALGALNSRRRGGVVLKPLAKIQQSLDIQLARRRRPAAVEHLPERLLRPGRVVREEAFGQKGVALRSDGIVLILSEPNPLENGEGSENVSHPGWDLEYVAVLLELLHLLCDCIHIDNTSGCLHLGEGVGGRVKSQGFMAQGQEFRIMAPGRDDSRV